MANPEFKLMGKLAEEVRRGIVYPLGKTGFYNTDQYESLLRRHGFLTRHEEDLIDGANSRIRGRSKADLDNFLEERARQSLYQKDQLLIPEAIVLEKERLRSNLIIPKYEETMPWLNWYKEVEPLLQPDQMSREIAQVGGWVIAADRNSRGLKITEYYKDGKATMIVTPFFGEPSKRRPFHFFSLHSSRFESLDEISRASYTELWYMLLTNSLFPPSQSNIQKAIEGFVEKQQAQNTA